MTSPAMLDPGLCSPAQRGANLSGEAAFTWRYPVEFEQEIMSNLCLRIIGARGENMKRIVDAAGGKAARVKVQLRGCWSRLSVPETGPLTIHVQANDATALAKAKVGVLALMDEITAEVVSLAVAQCLEGDGEDDFLY